MYHVREQNPVTDRSQHHDTIKLARLDLTPDWKGRFWTERGGHGGTEGRRGGGLAPKPAMGSSTIMVIFLGPPAGKQVQRRIQTEQTRLERGRGHPNKPHGFYLAAVVTLTPQREHLGWRRGDLDKKLQNPCSDTSAQALSGSLFPCRLPWFLESTQIQEWSQGGWECRPAELWPSRN